MNDKSKNVKRQKKAAGNKKEITGPLADACSAFAAFVRQQPYYKPTKGRGKK